MTPYEGAKSRKTCSNSIASLAKRAVASGASWATFTNGDPNFSRLVWNIAGSCENPFIFERSAEHYDGLVPQGQLRTIEIHARCRKCYRCRSNDRVAWFHRAKEEALASHRTWLVTLTFSPRRRAQLLDFCRYWLQADGEDYDALLPERRFSYMAKACGLDVQRYFKRLRKHGCEFRYLGVFEEHKDGFPHFHCLLHETKPESCKKRPLKKKWPMISDVKLVSDDHGLWYPVKYLRKEDAPARVRASKEYGNPPYRPSEAW